MDNKKLYDIMYVLYIYGLCRGFKNMNLCVLVIYRVYWWICVVDVFYIIIYEVVGFYCLNVFIIYYKFIWKIFLNIYFLKDLNLIIEYLEIVFRF